MKIKTIKGMAVAGLLAFSGTSMLLPQSAEAHCQIPCGIYDDHARVESMLEDVQTITKSLIELKELEAKNDAQSLNQKVRWINNKEIHAQKIIQTISDYFLTQRVKTSQKDYSERLIKHHAVILAAMAVKQNTESSFVETLKKAVEALAPYYPEHKH